MVRVQLVRKLNDPTLFGARPAAGAPDIPCADSGRSKIVWPSAAQPTVMRVWYHVSDSQIQRGDLNAPRLGVLRWPGQDSLFRLPSGALGLIHAATWKTGKHECDQTLTTLFHVSHDEGRTWTRSRNEVFAMLERSVRGCYAMVEPAVAELNDEAIDGVYRHRLTCAISRDEGRTWQNHKNLESLDDVTPIEPEEPETFLMGPIRQPTDRQRYPRTPGALRCNQPSCSFLDDKALITYPNGRSWWRTGRWPRDVPARLPVQTTPRAYVNPSSRRRASSPRKKPARSSSCWSSRTSSRLGVTPSRAASAAAVPPAWPIVMQPCLVRSMRP